MRMRRSLVRKILLRALRRLSAKEQAGILLAFGVLLGAALAYLIFPKCLPQTSKRNVGLTKYSSSYVPPGDKCDEASSLCYVFVFATGRSGTQHLSRVLSSKSKSALPAYITHEEEHLSARTKFIVERDYRRIASALDEAGFNSSSREYVSNTKIPFYNALLKRYGSSRLVYTGHLPMAFGMGPALIENLPKGSIRVLRMRRDRIATAVSLMALGPEREDPWGSTEERDETGKLTQAASVNRRWFPKPTDAMIRLHVASTTWTRLNRFQRWLWYVDDVECRWQALRRGFHGKFSWLEEGLENLNVLDAGAGWERIASFIGVSINWSQVGQRDNSIEHKMRAKINASETMLRKWDVEYRQAVGPCRIHSKLSYGWDGHEPDT